jgi:NitT/TauT family transport system substrate-binding protein
MNIRTSLFLVAAVLATGSIAALGHGEEAATVPGSSRSGSNEEARPELVIAALRGPTGVGIAPYLADGVHTGDSGTYRFAIVPDPTVMVARLASGEAAVGMLPANVAAQLYNRGVPIQIGAVTLWGLLYVVGPEGAVAEWSDLEGMTLQSIARGATPDLVTRHLLSESGVDPETDVTLQYQFAPAELAQLVALGQEDLAVLPEPFVTQVLSRRDDLAVLLDHQAGWESLYGTSYPQTVVVVRTDVAAAHPDAIDEALQLIDDGWATVVDDPAAAGDLVANSDLGMPAAVVASALPRFNARYRSAAESAAALTRYFTVLHAFDPRSVGGSVPDAAILYGGDGIE